LDNLIPKEVQRISNIKGTNGKSVLNPTVLAAIKMVRRQISTQGCKHIVSLGIQPPIVAAWLCECTCIVARCMMREPAAVFEGEQ